MARIEDQQLVKELLQQELVTKEQLIKIQEVAKATLESDGISKTLLNFIDINELKLAEIISEIFNAPLLKEMNGLSTVSVHGFTKTDFLHRFKMLPIIIDNNELTIATINPPYQNYVDLIKSMTKLHVVPVIITASDFDHLVEFTIKDVEVQKSIDIDFELLDVAKRGEKWAHDSDVSGSLPTAIRVLEKIIETAVNSNASDIHFEMLKTGFLNVRFRLDGVLQRVVTLPQSYSKSLPGVIKQSGSAGSFDNKILHESHGVFEIHEKQINTRINTIITSYGEKIIIRVLKKDLRIMSLNQLGLSLHDLQIFKQLLTYPDAIMLFAGPSGCGKTTTMYSALSELNHNSLNISTVENPIECQIEGINQTSVDQIRNNTISDTIKALFHHDVDILAIGEIREKEEANLLIEAGLTGMVACSSLQSSNAIKALYRLINFGVKYDELALVLGGIIAQRFVRKICPHCVETYRPDKVALENAGLKHLPSDFEMQQGKGCKACLGSGYLGRMPLFEILIINDRISSLIHKGSSYCEVKMEAEKSGFTNLRYDGLRKVLAGITTLEEVLRVT
jgi:type IV pilus assembly protein PilB